MYGNDAVVYNENDAEDNLQEWNRRRESLTRVFENDLNEVVLQKERNNLSREQIFKFTLDSYPLLLKMYIGKKVTIETMFLLNKLDEYLKLWHNSSMLLWEEERRRIEKCEGFVKFDAPKLSQIYSKFLGELD
jgi:IS30 family transposase